MAKEKIDQVLEELKTINKRLGSLEQGQQDGNKRLGSLEQGQQDGNKRLGSLEQNQQKNYDLIQKNGVKIEQIASDVRAVAEGHGILLNKIDEVNASVAAVDGKLEETRRVVGETNRMLKEHIRQPAHAI